MSVKFELPGKKPLSHHRITPFMGLDISGIMAANKVKLDDYKGRAIALDGYNVLYQFLSSIRGRDGTPLQDERGRVTSHLSGALYRTANLLELGIKPIYVFDGKPHPLKSSTLAERRARKEKAKIEWDEALAEGDMEKARTKAQQTSRLTRDMVDEAIILLNHMGVPTLKALEEGEAQASYMALKGDVHASGSQDFDSLLFGTPLLVRNMTLSGRRKMPRRQVYVTIEPEEISLQAALDALEINREQLVDLGVLMGTDFNDGVRGIGPKKALKLVREFGSGEEAIRKKNLDVPGFEAVRKIFLEPKVTDDYTLEWHDPDNDKIIEFMCEEYGFSRNRVDSILGKLDNAKKARSQQSLDQWF